MTINYGSVCSGIEAATVAWHSLGWKPQFFSEIEAAPRAVLSHRWPGVPLHGDFTTIQDRQYGAIDLLVGGTPCQSFSVAGLRGGLADGRGNLALEYLRLAQRLSPRWLVWENVPGVLSSEGGRDFGAILGGMVELGYGFAYRVLDAQYIRVDGFGRAVPQRRRRVFVVGHLGDWRRAAAVLLERACLRGDLAPSRSAGEVVAPTISSRPTGGGGLGTDFDCDGGLIAKPLLSGGHANNPLDENLIAFDTTQITSAANYSNPQPGEPCHPLAAGAHAPAIALQGTMLNRQEHAGPKGPGFDVSGTMFTLTKADVHAVAHDWAVRRLTPLECERLQGFPLIKNTLTVRVCEAENNDNASSAKLSSQAQNLEVNEPAVATVRIDLERSAVEIHRAGRLIWSASTAAAPSSSPLSMPLDAFVRLAAHTITTAVQQTQAGRAGSHQSISSSSDRWNGNAFVGASGREIAELAKGADRFTETVSRCMKSITSQSGLSSQTSEQSLQISFYCVVAAIASCIPEAMSSRNSYAVSLEVTHGYTAVPWRSGLLSDGSRYKALGNSMAVNCMRWIGRRIEAVDAMQSAPALMAAE